MRCARKFYPFGLKCVCSSYCFYADHTIYEFFNLNRIITVTTVVEGTVLQTRCLNMSKPGKHDDDDSRDWMIGSLGHSKTQKVQRFHQISFSYSSIMLSLRYYLFLFYTNLNNTSPVSYLFFNRINELISSLLLQEHSQRNKEVSGIKIYSSKMFYASFMLTLLFI